MAKKKKTNKLPRELKQLEAKKFIPLYYPLGSWGVGVLNEESNLPPIKKIPKALTMNKA